MALITQPNDFDKKAFALGEKIQTHTIQLLQKSDIEYKYNPCASGILVQIGTNYFLFTASHVIRDLYDNGKELFVSTERGILPLKGRRNNTDLEKDNDTDIAYFFLNDQFAQLLTKTYQFLPSNKMGDLIPDVPSTQYLIVGYPAVNITVMENTVTTGAQVYLTGPSKPEIYSNARLDETKHYMFEYGQNMTDLLTGNEVFTLPNREGISGCGIWFISGSQQNDIIEYDYSLVGILKGGSDYHLRGTKIGLLIRDLKKLEGI